jgi:hypothetical protein
MPFGADWGRERDADAEQTNDHEKTSSRTH